MLAVILNIFCVVQVVNHFEPAGAAALLEEEIRQALLGTAGTAAGWNPQMFFSASVLYLLSVAGCMSHCQLLVCDFGLTAETLYYTALTCAGKDCHSTHLSLCWKGTLSLLLLLLLLL